MAHFIHIGVLYIMPYCLPWNTPASAVYLLLTINHEITPSSGVFTFHYLLWKPLPPMIYVLLTIFHETTPSNDLCNPNYLPRNHSLQWFMYFSLFAMKPLPPMD